MMAPIKATWSAVLAHVLICDIAPSSTVVPQTGMFSIICIDTVVARFLIYGYDLRMRVKLVVVMFTLVALSMPSVATILSRVVCLSDEELGSTSASCDGA